MTLLLLLLVCSLVFAQEHSFSQRTSLLLRTSLRAPLDSAQRWSRDLRLALESLPAIFPARQQRLATSPVGVHCKVKPPQLLNGSQSTSPATTTASSTSTTARSSPSAIPPSPYKISWNYSGSEFFDQWDWWTFGDPTHGTVDYISSNAARDSGLAYVNDDGNFIMKVETTPKVSALRKSVRIHSQKTFNGGLLLMDASHMPTGCGTWPAWWTNGPDWPENGEIDIAEGVSDHTHNQATVHTGLGCRIPDSFNSASSFAQVATGQLVGGTNCAVADTNNQGCGVRFQEDNSFGASFNAIKGGVYALDWDDSGLSIYFFPRSKIPADILAGEPNPARWGKPGAMWPSGSCDPYRYFREHIAIFDTTLCGDWAGNVWGSAGIPGQEQSCAQRTGVSDCVSYVLNNGDAFKEAYWEVSYVKLYRLK